MRRYQIILFALITTIVVALFAPLTGTIPQATGANANIGFVDDPFGVAPGTDPTADKPQSKLWFNDGAWWAVMFQASTSTWRIYKLTWPNKWNPTTTVIDTRATSRADALWDGQHLYIASLVRFSPSNVGQFSRYSYNASTQTYTRDVGFPATMMTGSAETLAMDKDSTGKFWITYTQGNRVYVNRTTGSDTSWGTPFIVPGATTLDPDDISSIVAYHDADGNSVGVLWSNHTAPSSMYFSYHRDGDPDTTWQPIEQIYTSKCAADDHINIKSLQADPGGSIYAALKTSNGDSGCGSSNSDPLLRLVVRRPNNTWEWATFGTVSDQHTRPLVLLDTTNRKVYMFATAPTSCGVIYMKSTSMDNLSFPSGKGTPFISSSTYTCINNVTSTKQTVDAVSDLVVMASDESKRVYLHNVLDLGTPTPRLLFSAQPGTSNINQPLPIQPVVTILNAKGQTDTTFNGSVTLAIKSGTGTLGATLLGTVTRNAAAGVATFTDLAINKGGTGYQLTATAAGYQAVDSTMFNINKNNQTITFGAAPTGKRYLDAPFTVSATSSSGLAVSFSDANPNDACTVSGATITTVGAGLCTVKADQAGNGDFNPAPTITQGFTILKANQSISFELPTNNHFGDPPFRINGSATSNLPITFSATGACTITDENLLTLTGPQKCYVTAKQPGDTNFNAAPSITQELPTDYKAYIPMAR